MEAASRLIWPFYCYFVLRMEVNLKDRLRAWMAAQMGPGKRFANPTAWGKRAGISSSTMARVYETGAVSPQTLADLARSVGQDPLNMLVEYGFIKASDVASSAGLTPDQRAALAILEELPEGAARQAFLAQLPGVAAGVQALVERGLLQRLRSADHQAVGT